MSKLRRSMLYVPGNNSGMMADANIYKADAIMFDLEDSVSVNEKDSARLMVYNAIREVDFNGSELVVRINSLDSGLGQIDIRAMVKAGVDVIRLPKTERAIDVLAVEAQIVEAEADFGLEVGKIKIMAAIESPLGVMNAYRIATATKRMIGIAIGAEDFVTKMGTNRSADGAELMVARSQILMAARAADICAIDTVYSDVNNEEGFRHEVKNIKQLGFDGKSIINPRQIGIVHEIFTPTKVEIEHAIRVKEAIKEAESRNSGVIALDGKMVDKPIVDRADRILTLAAAAGVF